MGTALDIAYGAGLVVSSPVWASRLALTGKWRTDWPGRFGRVTQTIPPGGLLIHAVSVGEVNAIRGLVRLLAQRHPGMTLTISATTNTGFARAVDLFGERHHVVRFPLDFSRSVGHFLDAVQPSLVALTELEVWPNFMDACTRRGIATCVINGRLSERSFNRYRLARFALARRFAGLATAAVQTEAYRKRFVAMGCPAQRVRVLDSMKWDNAEVTDRVEGSEALSQALGIDNDRPLVVAGSTGPGEEKMLVAACPREVQLLIAPRKPERFDTAAAAMREAAPASQVVRRSDRPDGEAQRPEKGRRLFLLDTLGELKKAYALGDVAVVGRSFLSLHGSDPTEPIALGKPTLIGPHHSDFQDMIDAFREADGIKVTHTPGEAIRRWLRDPGGAAEMAKRGRAVILSRQGATQRHADLIDELLRDNRSAEPDTA